MAVCVRACEAARERACVSADASLPLEQRRQCGAALLWAVARAAVGVDLCGLDDPSLEHVGCNAPASASVALCRLPRDVSLTGILVCPACLPRLVRFRSRLELREHIFLKINSYFFFFFCEVRRSAKKCLYFLLFFVR